MKLFTVKLFQIEDDWIDESLMPSKQLSQTKSCQRRFFSKEVKNKNALKAVSEQGGSFLLVAVPSAWLCKGLVLQQL